MPTKTAKRIVSYRLARHRAGRCSTYAFPKAKVATTTRISLAEHCDNFVLLNALPRRPDRSQARNGVCEPGRGSELLRICHKKLAVLRHRTDGDWSGLASAC